MTASNRRYLNFVTRRGNDLTRLARHGAARFLIHDCGYLAKLNGWNHPGVDSPFWRFYHNTTPGCFVTWQGRRIPLRPSSALVIPEDTVFDCNGPRSASHFWIHFSVVSQRPRELRSPVELSVDGVLAPLLEDARGLAETPAGALRDQRLYHAASAVLHAAFRRVDFPLQHPAPDALSAVCAFIRAEPAADLSNGRLAARAGMSVRKFTSRFQEHASVTPAQYVREQRVRLAREALVLCDDSIEHIAESLGFPNRHYFTRVFTELAGCSPAEYRRRQRPQ